MKTHKSIAQLRSEVDKIDKQIAKLCVQRVFNAQKIFNLKSKSEMPIVDLKREKSIYGMFIKKLKKSSSEKKVRLFVRQLILLNSKYPNK